MKRLLFILLLALPAAAQSQTIRTLGFNTTNGQVVANTGTNVLTFTSNVAINKLELPNGTFVDDSQFSAPQYADALLSFEESRLYQYGLNVLQWYTNGSVAFGNAAATRTNLGLGPFTAGDGFAELRDATNGLVLEVEDGVRLLRELAFATANASSNSRVNLGIPLLALTNTSNVTMMRALSGSTNTNHPYSGSISVVGTNNTNTLVFSNGILQSVQ